MQATQQARVPHRSCHCRQPLCRWARRTHMPPAAAAGSARLLRSCCLGFPWQRSCTPIMRRETVSPAFTCSAIDFPSPFTCPSHVSGQGSQALHRFLGILLRCPDHGRHHAIDLALHGTISSLADVCRLHAPCKAPPVRENHPNCQVPVHGLPCTLLELEHTCKRSRTGSSRRAAERASMPSHP